MPDGMLQVQRPGTQPVPATWAPRTSYTLSSHHPRAFALLLFSPPVSFSTMSLQSWLKYPPRRDPPGWREPHRCCPALCSCPAVILRCCSSALVSAVSSPPTAVSSFLSDGSSSCARPSPGYNPRQAQPIRFGSCMPRAQTVPSPQQVPLWHWQRKSMFRKKEKPILILLDRNES